jgi:hypothetical protein
VAFGGSPGQGQQAAPDKNLDGQNSPKTGHATILPARRLPLLGLPAAKSFSKSDPVHSLAAKIAASS